MILGDGTEVSCREFYDINLTWTGRSYMYTYDCQIPCPDGSTVTAKEMIVSGLREAVVAGEPLAEVTLDMWQKQYCPVAPVETETPTPTPLAAEDGAVPVAVPLLTEKVTACDYKAGFVNFELVDPAQNVNEMEMTVAFNQAPVNCEVPNNNPNILSCSLPSDIRFPFNVSVEVDGALANDFDFDGSYCGYKDPSEAGGGGGESGGSSDGPVVMPTATDVHP